MNPVQKWQNGLALTDYEKQVVKKFGYNPDVPYNNQAAQGTSLQNAPATSQTAGVVPTNSFQNPVPNVVGGFYSQPTGADQGSTSISRNNVGSPFDDDLASFGGDGSASGSSGSGGETDSVDQYEPQYRFIQGDPTVYDVNNPQQAEAYYNKLVENASRSADAARTKLRDTSSRTLEASSRQFADNATTLDENLQSEQQNEADYARGYDNRVEGFGKNYRTGIASRQNVFASANGFQSSQGDSEGMATDEYGKGLDDLSAEKTSNQNAFSLTRGKLARQKGSLDQGYQDYLNEQASVLGEKEAAIDHGVADVKARTASELAPIDYENGVTDFNSRYKLESYDPTQTNNADLSKYSKATSFSALPGQAGSTPQNAFANLNAEADPYSQYMDYQKKKKETSPMKQYLYA